MTEWKGSEAISSKSGLSGGCPRRGAAGGARHCLQGGGDDIAVHAAAVQRAAGPVRGTRGAVVADLDVSGGQRGGTGGDRVPMIIEYGQCDATITPQGVDKSGDRPIADAFNSALLAPGLDGR